MEIKRGDWEMGRRSPRVSEDVQVCKERRQLALYHLGAGDGVAG